MFVALLIQCLLLSVANSISEHPVLIVISYDAFRYNFFKKNATPNMERLRSQGCSTAYMQNVFPTKTFPNHHSIATGMYAETHGVIENSFYDPDVKQIIKYGHEMYHYNEAIEPIWRLNEKAGNHRHSGVMMWPGGVFPYQNETVTHLHIYDSDFPWEKRVETVISWIKNETHPANFVVMYFSEPDALAHAFGPDSEAVFNILQRLDKITLYLEEQLQLHKLTEKVNVVHLSDHGMTSVSPSKFIDLTKYLKPNTYVVAGSSPGLHIIPKEGFEEEVFRRLDQASSEHGHFTVFNKTRLLNRWHFKNNRRVPPIFVLADKGYGFQDMLLSLKYYEEKYNITVTNSSKFGIHGYDNQMSDMHPFFMARGPKIKTNHKVPPFDTVDLLSLFCAILEIPEVPNNGSFSNVRDILISGSNNGFISVIIIAIGGTVGALLFISCAAVITLFMIKRQQSITTSEALNKRFPQTFSHSTIEAQHLLEAEDA